MEDKKQKVESAIAEAKAKAKVQDNIDGDTMPSEGVEIGGVKLRAVSAFDLMLMAQIDQKKYTEIEMGMVWAYALSLQKPQKLWRLMKKPETLMSACLEWTTTVAPDAFVQVLNYAMESVKNFSGLVETEIGTGGDDEGNV